MTKSALRARLIAALAQRQAEKHPPADRASKAAELVNSGVFEKRADGKGRRPLRGLADMLRMSYPRRESTPRHVEDLIWEAWTK